ncbi:MAG: S8 family serine peptidase [Deltaproteobacteria bacterium]|nr:S8 family serine peptidase [Deltaproteobacteria bacterium]
MSAAPSRGARRLLASVAALGLLVPGVGTPARAAEPRGRGAWTDLLTRDEVGATAWAKAHPTWDGRGVVVAVLDTGVDPSVPGLDRLPTGEGPKVIETRDFSGQGHVALTRARAAVDNGVAVLRVDGDDPIVVRGHDKLADKPRTAGLYWLGAFSERSLAGSDVDDLDRDGRRDGRFAVLVFEPAGGEPVAVIDLDGDGDLSNEAARRSYGAEPRHFAFGRPADPLRNRPPVAVTLHIDLDERRVELHFDDGGHGTHCAGIAAGWRIEGKDGFDGIAPGARVMSLKIGHGALPGGATTQGSMVSAIRHASRWARERQTPVVINLSYGVGSETEGHADIDKILDDELAQNPWLAIATSAGNEGPGLSSLGTPAAATLAWASAAMLTEGQARTLFGGNSKGRKVFAFSSRGGELDKPDGLAPGTAWSTVPPFATSSVMSGTSMASPQAAGVHALLASAALAERLPWTNGLAHRALTTGAKPIAGFSSLDQGAGLIDVRAAWEAYRKEAREPGATTVAGWRISTSVPHAPGRTGSASYWRVGRHLPEPTEAITFTVQPILYMSVDEDRRAAHFDTVTLDPDVAWLSTDRDTVALRGAKAADVVVRLDAERLAGRAGVHVGRVRGRARGVHAFDLPVVVVVPEALAPGTWTQAFGSRLAPGDVGRVFVQVPPGATTMSVTMAVKGKGGAAWLLPFDPEGRHVELWEHQASGDDDSSAAFTRGGDQLAPGTWELALYAPHRNRGPVEVAVDVAFRALDAPAELAYQVGEDGAVKADLALTNRLDEPFRGDIEVRMVGVTRARPIETKAAVATVPIALGGGVGRAELDLEVDEATWARMTDIAIRVTDASGASVAQSAFGQRRARVTIDRGAGRYTLEVTAALADPDDAKAWTMTLTERHRWATPRAFEVALPAGMRRATLLPNVPLTLGLTLAGGLPETASGFSHEAEVALTDRAGHTWARWSLGAKRR